MSIERIELHHLALPLVSPFEISVARVTHSDTVLVSVHGGGLTGWGECPATVGPYYSYETSATAWHILRDHFIPAVLGRTVARPADVPGWMSHVRGHPLARAALENAVWDLLAQARGCSLRELLGGERARVPVGVSIGIQPDVPALLETVERHLQAGYRRIKLKIKPGWDVVPVQAVRERWPDLLLQVDANTAYTLADLPVMQALDACDLLLIEQPLHHDDIVDHAELQRHLRTPICLDESIHSPDHARWALQIGACRVINIKVGRVGGFTAARRIHDLCAEQGIPVWCGGMLETNVGRAANLALASLPNFTLPGDISASRRYYHEDIAEPDFELNPDSTIDVPAAPGLGVRVRSRQLHKWRDRHEVFSYHVS
ncbi:MAG: o-succinylbenzoate synthase [Caldilineae bacterium]|nr:MAG: o-succinylbenzoate synthase [Caldilineae bacterium]